MSIKFLVLLCHLIITFSNKNKIFWRYFCTLSTEHTDHAENVSTQHVQKNVFFAHPHRNLLPLLRWTWIECNHEERTAGLTQGWRSVKFSYFYCVWGFATQIYGGLWIPPSITDKCKDRRWNSVFQHSTWFFFSLHRAIFAFFPFHYNNNSPYPHVFKPVFQRLLNMALLHRHTDSLLFQCICSSPNTNHRHARSPQIISLINVMFSCAFMSICDQPRPDIA